VGKYGTNLEGFGAFEGGVNADKGAPLVSTSSDGETALLFGPAALREIQAGVANGDFAIPPDAAGDTITEENPLPYWTFTDVDSAGAITAAIVADSTAASGNVVRFSVGTITGAKTVILSRYIAIPSSRDRAFAVFPEAYVGSNTGDTKITTSLRWSWYTSTFTVTGTGGTTSVSDSGSTTLRPTSATTLAAPSDASYIYVEVLVKTIDSLASNKRVDLFEVRLSQGGQVAVIAEKATPQTYKPLTISQDGGNPTFDYDTAGNATFTGNVSISGANSLWVSRASVASSAQSLTNNTSTTILLDTASTTPTTGTYDPKSWFNNANDRIEIGQAGFYAVSANIAFAANATGRRALNIVINGSDAGGVQVLASPVGSTILSVSTNLYLAANDLVTISAIQQSGGALNTVVVAGVYPALSVGRIGA